MYTLIAKRYQLVDAKFLLVPILMTSLLIGCGGGSENSSPPHVDDEQYVETSVLSDVDDQVITIGETFTIDISNSTDETLNYGVEPELSFVSIDDNTLLFSPDEDDVGSYSITLFVEGKESITPIVFNITVDPPQNNPPNTPPVIDSIEDIEMTATESKSFVITVVDSEDAKVSIDFGELPEFISTERTDPNIVTLTLLPSLKDVGEYLIKVIVSDGIDTVISEFIVTIKEPLIANQPPYIEEIAPIAINENQTMSLGLSAKDVDGDQLSFSFYYMPDFIEAMDNEDGTASLEMTPSFEDEGDYEIKVKVFDGQLEAESSFKVTVNNVNRAPHIGLVNDVTIYANERKTVEININDEDKDSLIIVSENVPEFVMVGDFTSNKLVVDIEPNNDYVGTHDVSIEVNDGKLSSWVSFSIRIEYIPDIEPQQISAGSKHNCFILNGELSCWGSNDYGELDIPEDLSHPIAVAAGSLFTCVIDGVDVKCWGLDHEGLIDVPEDVHNPSTIVNEGNTTCVLQSDDVICWRYGISLSQETKRYYLSYTTIIRKLDFNQPFDLSVSYDPEKSTYQACVLDLDGVHCWGDTDFSRGGENSVVTMPEFEQIPKAVSAGSTGNCVIKQDGKLSCWGNALTNKSRAVDPGPDIVADLLVTLPNKSCIFSKENLVLCGPSSKPYAVLTGWYSYYYKLNPIRPSTYKRMGRGCLPNIKQWDNHWLKICALDDSGAICWGPEGENEMSIPNRQLTVNVTGLEESKILKISNDIEELTISENGSYLFSEIYSQNFDKENNYAFGVTEQPKHQFCMVKQACPTVIDLICTSNRYTKIDSNGEELPDSAAEWDCVRDNEKNLVWEVKNDNIESRQYFNWAFRWGTDNWGADFDKGDSSRCTMEDNGINCTVIDYVAKMNELKLCGIDNWRVPEFFALSSLIECSNGTKNDTGLFGVNFFYCNYRSKEDSTEYPASIEFERLRSNTPTVNRDYFPYFGSSRYWNSDMRYVSFGEGKSIFDNGGGDRFGLPIVLVAPSKGD